MRLLRTFDESSVLFTIERKLFSPCILVGVTISDTGHSWSLKVKLTVFKMFLKN